jgi:hypothetical protein
VVVAAAAAQRAVAVARQVVAAARPEQLEAAELRLPVVALA